MADHLGQLQRLNAACMFMYHNTHKPLSTIVFLLYIGFWTSLELNALRLKAPTIIVLEKKKSY